jgi:Mlc titration factor MtfA (ptsG expression regulator)
VTRAQQHSGVNLRPFAYALASAFERIFTPQRARRQAILSAPFPGHWKDFLETRSDHYRRLPVAYRAQFDQQAQMFLAEKRITGIETQVSDEMKLLVAASAVMLSVGWPGYTWDQLTEVLVYPDNFDRDYRFGGTDLAGQAHPWGIVILSAPALLRSFAETAGGYHLGVHEFAHLLDLAHNRFNGIPADLSDESIRKWLTIMEQEEERLRRGDSELSPYGLSGPEELFAVAVEAFFQTPVALTRSHRELYAFLSSYFRQDPAAWSSSTSR